MAERPETSFKIRKNHPVIQQRQSSEITFPALQRVQAAAIQNQFEIRPKIAVYRVENPQPRLFRQTIILIDV